MRTLKTSQIWQQVSDKLLGLQGVKSPSYSKNMFFQTHHCSSVCPRFILATEGICMQLGVWLKDGEGAGPATKFTGSSTELNSGTLCSQIKNFKMVTAER